MSNFLSFSLYGDEPKYINGALACARDAPLFYPDWIPVFYVGSSVPEAVCLELRDLGAHIISKETPEDNTAMLWRYEAFLIPGASLVQVRDCDSRFSSREVAAVQDWVGSGHALHVMRDHVYHRWEMLGGLWGGRATELRGSITRLLQDVSVDCYGYDQELLSKHVYSNFRSDSLVHDSVFCREFSSRPFPTSRVEGGYLGEVVDACGTYDVNLRKLMVEFDTNLIIRLKIKARDLFTRPAISSPGKFVQRVMSRIFYYLRVAVDIFSKATRRPRNHP